MLSQASLNRKAITYDRLRIGHARATQKVKKIYTLINDVKWLIVVTWIKVDILLDKPCIFMRGYRQSQGEGTDPIPLKIHS